MHQFEFIDRKINTKGPFRTLVIPRLFQNLICYMKVLCRNFHKICSKFNFSQKISQRKLSYECIDQKLNPKSPFRPLVKVYGLWLWSYKKILCENLHINAHIRTWWPKTEFEKSVTNLGGVTFVTIQFFTKKFSAKIFI